MGSPLQNESAPTARETTFDNSGETTPQITRAATAAAGEDLEAAELLQGLVGESPSPDRALNLNPEPASIRAPYIGEDTRVTLLRWMDDKFQEWAGKPCHCPVNILAENIDFFRLTTRGSIQYVGELQKGNGELQQHNYRLQQHNEALQRDYQLLQRENQQLRSHNRQMKERIPSLEHSNETLKVKYEDMERNAIELEQIAARLRNENSRLREEVEEARLRRGPVSEAELLAGETERVECEADSGEETPSKKRRRKD